MGAVRHQERGGGSRKKRLKDDVERRNKLVVARDVGRFASELDAVGEPWRISIAARGWLGRFLAFDGFVSDGRRPIMMAEMSELLGLYLLEREEEEDARREAGGG